MSAPPRPIQCSTGPFWAFELERAFDLIAAAGFTEVELMVTRDPSTQVPDIPKRLADERGLRIASVHAPFLVVTKTVWGTDPIGKIERGAEMCSALEADSMVVHPPYLWEREYTAWIRTEAADFTRRTGITVAVETMYPKWVAGRRLRAYRWLDPAELARAAPHVALDTSHLAVARHDILNSLRTLLPKLVHVHLSNNAGDGRDGHLEVERGVLPLERLLGELRKSEYRGAVSLELGVRRYVQREQELVDMLRRNKRWVEKHLTAAERPAKGLPRT